MSDRPPGPTADDGPDPAPDVALPPPADDHDDEGLDFARRAARAAAGSRPAAARKRRTNPRDKRAPRAPISGAHPDERDPQLLDTTVERLVSDRGWELDLKVHALFGRWSELVGAEVASHTTAESFAEGTLVVRTDSTAWATQLKYLVPTLLRRLNEELGHGTVTLIEIVGPAGPSWKKGPRSVRDGRGPRDTYG